MSNSHRLPYHKYKIRWFQKYYNRKERRHAKRMLNSGEYEIPEGRITPPRSYDVIDLIVKPHGRIFPDCEDMRREWRTKQSRK